MLFSCSGKTLEWDSMRPIMVGVSKNDGNLARVHGESLALYDCTFTSDIWHKVERKWEPLTRGMNLRLHDAARRLYLSSWRGTGLDGEDQADKWNNNLAGSNWNEAASRMTVKWDEVGIVMIVLGIVLILSLSWKTNSRIPLCEWVPALSSWFHERSLTVKRTLSVKQEQTLE